MSRLQTYNLTPILWPLDGVIVVVDVSDHRIATFSCQFLRSGHVFSWGYILDACRDVVIEPGLLYPCFATQISDIRSSDMPQSLPMDQTPIPGTYRYLRIDDVKSPVTWTVGPRFKYKFRGPSTGESDGGTMSHSSRSTAQQNAFRNQLYKRDGFCIVTNEDDADAAHILPQSRPEHYTEALRYDPVHYFHVSFGILLDRTLHTAFDRGDWGLFPDPSDPSALLVHIFNSKRFKDCHGQQIPAGRFRIKDRSDLPNRALLAFHYRQCLIKHIRGFAHFEVPSA